MEKSYNEILKLLSLAERDDLKSIVYKGSEDYLTDENTPINSATDDFLATISTEYSPEKPLYSSNDRHLIKYVQSIKRDALFEDLFKVLSE